jgi:hypothetical protein
MQNFASLWGATTTTKRIYNCIYFHAPNTEALSLIINRVKFREIKIYPKKKPLAFKGGGTSVLVVS